MKVRISADSINDKAKLDFRKPFSPVSFKVIGFSDDGFWNRHKKACIFGGAAIFITLIAVIGAWTSDDVKSLCSGGNARTASEYAGYSLRGVHAPAKVAGNMLFEKGTYKQEGN